MRRAGVLLVAGAIWLAIGPASASAAAAEETKSKPYSSPDEPLRASTAARGFEKLTVKVDAYSSRVRSAGPPGVWVGRLKTESGACESDRKVTMFRKRDGKDAKLGSAMTDPGANTFAVDAPKPKNGGRYYAKVEAVQVCGPGKSKTFKFPQDQPQ